MVVEGGDQAPVVEHEACVFPAFTVRILSSTGFYCPLL